MKKRITVASAVVAAAAAFTSALLARRARFFAQAPKRNETLRNAARELRVGPGADPARQRLLPHRRLSGIGGLRDLEY